MTVIDLLSDLNGRNPLMRNISNSEVISWLSCRRMYKYAFVYNLEPKVMSDPLMRGNIGHEAMQRYAEARIEGDDHTKALRAGQDVFQKALTPQTMAIVMETKYLWDRYMAFHNGWPEWNLYQPEQKFELTLTDTIKMVIRYDAMVEEKRSGKRLIGDFKFTYDFWTPDDHDLNPQMPKYISVMNANGIEVHGGFLEEIRTRKLGPEKSADPKYTWRRTFYYPPLAKQTAMLRQHIAASLEIERYRDLPEKEQEAEAIPLLAKHGACKFCNFKDLCNSENNGKTDLTVDIQVGYQANTYGYNTEEVLNLI